MTWMPQACTLPTEEQLLRVAEFDGLFAAWLRAVDRPAPTRARLTLDGHAEDRARALAAKETGCCSFFAFTFERAAAGRVLLDVTVPREQAAVLDALMARAEAGLAAP